MEWNDLSIQSLKELQIQLSKDRLKVATEDVLHSLYLEHPYLTRDEITYLCLQHCLEYVDLEGDNLP